MTMSVSFWHFIVPAIVYDTLSKLIEIWKIAEFALWLEYVYISALSKLLKEIAVRYVWKLVRAFVGALIHNISIVFASFLLLFICVQNSLFPLKANKSLLFSWENQASQCLGYAHLANQTHKVKLLVQLSFSFSLNSDSLGFLSKKATWAGIKHG